MKIIKISTLILAIIGITTLLNCNKDTCDYIADTYTAPSPDGFPFRCDSGMDIAFLIDYTASMGGAIDSIKSSVTAIVNSIVTESGGNYRLSLSIYDEHRKAISPNYLTQADYTSLPASQRKIITSGTTTDQYLTMMEKFSYANSVSFASQLAKINQTTFNLGGGAGGPEPGGLLAEEIVKNNFAGAWRNNLTKLIIIVTDAPAGGDDDIANSIDDTFLNNLTTGPGGINAQGIQCLLVTSQAAGASNFETQLVDLNAEGMKITGANLRNIAPDIIQLIEDICTNNEG